MPESNDHEGPGRPGPLTHDEPVRPAKREWIADALLALGIGVLASLHLARALV